MLSSSRAILINDGCALLLQIDDDLETMWGQISGVAGQFKKTINAVASEIKDAVGEVMSLPPERRVWRVVSCSG